MARLLAGLPAFTCLLLLAPGTAQSLGVALTRFVDGYVEVPYSPLLVPRSGITVEAWAYFDGITMPQGVWWPTIVRQGLSAGNEDYSLRLNVFPPPINSWLSWQVVTTNNIQFTVNWTVSGLLSPWMHVAGTWDGQAAVLYVNGVQVGSAAGNGLPIRDLNNDVLRIGNGATSFERWHGQIDEVRLWPFARTAAEIQATMYQELVSVPGLVATWNLNGNFLDSSGAGLHATSSGLVTFAQSPFSLATPALPQPWGASTPGCLGNLLLAPTSAARVGNSAFGAMCTQTPPGAVAIWGGTLGVLPAPMPQLGVGIWLDPTVLVTFSAVANGLGAMRLGFPIPNTAPVGFQLALQGIVFDPCGSQGFTASNAQVVVIQP